MNDDYKEEFLTRLSKSALYKTLKEQCHEKDSEVVALVEQAASYAFQRTKTVFVTWENSPCMMEIIYSGYCI